MKIDTTQAVEAAAHAVGDVSYPGKGWGNQSEVDRDFYRADARNILEAALPHLARAYREALLDEATTKAIYDQPMGVQYIHVQRVLTAAADHVFGPAEQEKK